ncbi:lipopolysaccharide-induced tumor necrosis factor-alpha factor homolog isoform X2 [Cloeon dipterum]|uniref:lipopolysaccharide-induced tumor necrosis factor-alpha factor homolog isoform X2 n=1 Tax=Cloeon dipterum TaxID=197152 RepID=UPI00321FFEB8
MGNSLQRAQTAKRSQNTVHPAWVGAEEAKEVSNKRKKEMGKADQVPSQQQGPPPQAPPSYSQATGGVPPASPFTPGPVPSTHHAQTHGPTIVTTVVPVGPHPTHMICPSCHAEIDSSTETKPGLIAYISGFIIALCGCWCGCCLIPCCVDECMDVHHNCPNCKAYLGRFKR